MPPPTTGSSTRSPRARSSTPTAATSAGGCRSCAAWTPGTCTSRGRRRAGSRAAIRPRSSTTRTNAAWPWTATSGCGPVPEGHTLHRLAREQTALFAGRPVHVTSPQGRFAAGAELVDGGFLDRVTAYGKHLLASFGTDIVHVHLGLYGSLPPAPGSHRRRAVPCGCAGSATVRTATACGPTCVEPPPARC